jgi:hypothetical protein
MRLVSQQQSVVPLDEDKHTSESGETFVERLASRGRKER